MKVINKVENFSEGKYFTFVDLGLNPSIIHVNIIYFFAGLSVRLIWSLVDIDFSLYSSDFSMILSLLQPVAHLYKSTAITLPLHKDFLRSLYFCIVSHTIKSEIYTTETPTPPTRKKESLTVDASVV